MAQSPPQLEELTLDQIFQKYKGQWVAMTVTKRDKNLQPIAGKVVFAHMDRYRLRQEIAQLNDVCILFAGESRFPLFL
jgi:hypothetical protein